MAKRKNPERLDLSKPRRPGGFHPPTTFHPRKGFKDDANTSQALAAINREYFDKEFAVRTSIGPGSVPAEQHYEKSFRIKPKEEP